MSAWNFLLMRADSIVGATFTAVVVFAATATLMALAQQPARRVAICRMGVLVAFLVLVIRLLGTSMPAVQVDRLTPDNLLGLPLVPLRAAILSLNMVGLTVAIGSVMLAIFGSKRLRRACVPPRVSTRSVYQSFCNSVNAPARLLVSERLSRPVIVGILRPVIILPRHIEDAPITALRLALCHELAHLRRRDHQWAWLVAAANAFWFYLPMVWWIRAQSRLDEEVLTDHQSAAELGSRNAYASALVDTLGQIADIPQPKRACPALTTRRDAPRAHITTRVQTLLRAPFAIEARTPKLCLAGSLLAFTIVAGLAATHMSPGESVPDRPVPQTGKRPKSWTLNRLEITGPAAPTAEPAPTRVFEDLPKTFELTFKFENAARASAESLVYGQSLAIDPALGPRVCVRLVCDGNGVETWIEDVCLNRHGPMPRFPSILEIATPPRATIVLSDVALRATEADSPASRTP